MEKNEDLEIRRKALKLTEERIEEEEERQREKSRP